MGQRHINFELDDEEDLVLELAIKGKESFDVKVI